jgi:hypothetical protein
MPTRGTSFKIKIGVASLSSAKGNIPLKAEVD